jgi:hypothetical protein
MPNVGPGTWLVTGLIVLGFAAFSWAQNWQNGVLWKLLGGVGLAAVLFGYYKRGSAGSLPPSAGADYRSPTAPGLPAGAKVPLVSTPVPIIAG